MRRLVLAIAGVILLSMTAAAQTLRPVASLDAPPNLQRAITCNGGSEVIGISGDGDLYSWTMPDPRPHRIPITEKLQNHLACSHDGKFIAVAGRNGSLFVLDAATGKIESELHPRYQIEGFSLSADGSLIAIACDTVGAQLWDVHTGKLLVTAKGAIGTSAAAAISPDGKLLVSADEDTYIRAYDLSGKKLYESEAGDLEPFAIHFTPDGKQFAVAGAEGSVMLFDAVSGKRLKVSKSRGNPIFALMMAPDGQRIAALELDDFKLEPVAITVWNTQSGDLQQVKVDAKSVIGAGDDKSRLLLLSTETPSKLDILSVP